MHWKRWGDSGERLSPLTVTDVQYIRDRYEREEDITQGELATEYGVDQSSVSRIVTGQTWCINNLESVEVVYIGEQAELSCFKF